jgi:hypothetical protein
VGPSRWARSAPVRRDRATAASSRSMNRRPAARVRSRAASCSASSPGSIAGRTADALAGVAEGAEDGPLPRVGRAAPEPGLLEEIPDRRGQELGEACRQGVEQRRAMGAPGEPHQAMAELVDRPLTPVTRMETADHRVEPEVLVLRLGQHAVLPRRRRAQIGAALGQPVLRRGQVHSMLEVVQEQARARRQLADARPHGRAGDFPVGHVEEWAAHVAGI